MGRRPFLGSGIALFLRAWRYRYRLDPAEIDALLGALAPGDWAIDVGAHKGGYAYWLQRRVGPAGRVIAFEPQPDLADYLERALLAIGARHVVVERAAVSDHGGTALLHLRRGRSPCGATLEPRGTPGSLHSYPVRLTTLDDYLAERGGRVRAIKCDVEGHELAVFRGAARTLREHRPTLLFECEARHLPGRSVFEVLHHLLDLGYDGWFFQGARRIPLAEFREDMQRAPKARGYVNDLLFRPREPGPRRSPGGATGRPGAAHPVTAGPPGDRRPRHAG